MLLSLCLVLVLVDRFYN